MTRANPIHATFNGGEYSPRMVARTDFDNYRDGLALMENLIPLPQGGAMRRAGSRFVAAVKDETAHTHIMPFEFNTEQAYIIEKGGTYFRFYTLQGALSAPAVDAAITNGTFDTNLTGWVDASNGTGGISRNSDGYMDIDGDGSGNEGIAQQEVHSSSTENVLHILKFRVIGVADDELFLRIGTSAGASDIVNDVSFKTGYHCHEFTPSASPFYIQFRVHVDNTVGVDNVSFVNNATIEIETPYTTAQVHDVGGPQSADVLYLFHGSHPTHKLQRKNTNSWSLTEVAWTDGPYLDTNTDTSKTIAPSATTGRDITLTASGHSPFTADSVGRLVRISNPNSGTEWGAARITAVSAGQTATADVVAAFSTANQSSTWALGAWSTETGYPKVGTFFEQRFVAGNTTNQPQTLWLSQTASFENMTPDNRDGTNDGTVEDDDALSYTISSDQVNEIQWLVSLQDLVIGTAGGEWTLGSDGPVVKPTDTEVQRHTTHGSDFLIPVRNGPHILFVQRSKRKVRQFTFDTLLEGFQAFDLTRLSHHITRSNLHEIAFAQEPHLQVWCVREDGEVAVLTHSPEERVVGWTRYILGGSFGTGNAVVESVAVIPGNASTNSDDRNEVWLVVKRTINGATHRYIEFIEADFEQEDDQEDAFYVDSGLTYEGSAVTTITGLTHLIGETVGVWGDGAILPDVVVGADGTVTLAQSVAKAQIGLRFKHLLQSLKMEAGGAAGTAVGKDARIHELGLVVNNSLVFSVGPDSDNLIDIDFREVGDAMDTAPPLFTGEAFRELHGPWTTDPRYYLESDNPCPFTLLAVMPKLRTNDVK